MEKNRFCAIIEPSLCSDFIFTRVDSFGDPNVHPSFLKMRDVTILLNDRLTSQFDPVRLKKATTPMRSDDSFYQSMNDEQKFDSIKPRSIQQPADLELYNEILQDNADQIKKSAQDAADRARLLREIAQNSARSVSQDTNQQQQQQQQQQVTE